MIRRVEVSRDYKLTIYFNFNLDQFLHGLDCGGTIQAGCVNVRSACKDKNGNEKPHFVSKMRFFKAFSGFYGGDKRDRTADLLNAIQALSQLSYTPICHGAYTPEFT